MHMSAEWMECILYRGCVKSVCTKKTLNAQNCICLFCGYVSVNMQYEGFLPNKT